ncbi:serine hydrolase domain-containing protein [Photobacterium kagoshimensis]|uniref:serine hydrolase domain-containing protein n=1 Tax=Photobacterium kagoshimensis TaxID=2910242 RepID=UPI003D13EF6C
MMKLSKVAALVVLASIFSTGTAMASDTPESKFYEGYSISEIPMDAFQQWPYYTYASMHIKDFVRYGVFELPASTTPAPIKYDIQDNIITPALRADLISNNVKGFMVMKDSAVLAEHYDNGFKRGMLNNLQSASKTYVGVLLGKAVDAGLIDLNAQAKTYLPELEGSIVGDALIGNIARMDSGIEALGNYHTPGSNGYEWEKEIGLQNAGEPIGHLNAIKNAKASKYKPGTHWDYSDQNTDALALILAKVNGKPFEQLLSELHQAIGGHDPIEIAKTSDGTTSPSYGINTSLLDFTLFGQYIAQGKVGKAFYAELDDTSDDVLFKTPGAGEFLSAGGDVSYDMQSYYIKDKKIIYSHGSFGQSTFSDLETGITVAFLQDWSTNTDPDKLVVMLERATEVIEKLRK